MFLCSVTFISHHNSSVQFVFLVILQGPFLRWLHQFCHDFFNAVLSLERCWWGPRSPEVFSFLFFLLDQLNRNGPIESNALNRFNCMAMLTRDLFDTMFRQSSSTIQLKRLVYQHLNLFFPSALVVPEPWKMMIMAH